FAPNFDARYLSPHASRLVEPIGVGKNCRGIVFQVPRIRYRHKTARLYYLWFLDNDLARSGIIEPESRDSAIISFHVDHQLLISHFEAKIPKDYFDRLHVVYFYVSDTEYGIHGTRYIDETKESNEDYAYWIVDFNNDAC